MSDHRKCSKPGCGALSILGKACLDRDCPQTWVHYTAHNADIDRLTRELAEAQKDRDYWKVEAEGERAKVAYRDKQLERYRLTNTEENNLNILAHEIDAAARALKEKP